MSGPEDFDSDGSSQADAGRTQSQDAGRASGTDPNTENPVEELSEHGTQRTSGSFPSGTEVRSTEEAAQSEALPEHEAKRKSSSLQSGTEERGREEAAAQEEALRRDVDENQQEHQDTGRAAGTAPNAENLVEELSEHGAQRMSGSFQSGTEGRGTEEVAQNEALPEHEAKRKSSGLQSGTEERGREEAAAQEEALSRDVDENQQEHQDTGRKSSGLQSGTEERGREEAAAQEEALSRDVDENQQEHQDTGRAAGTAPNAENLDANPEPPTSIGQPKRKPRSNASEKVQKCGNSLEARAAQKQAKREKMAVKPSAIASNAEPARPRPPGPGCRWNFSTEVEVKPDEPSMATLARRPDAPDKLETGTELDSEA
eukprot:s2243_g7.t1